MKWSRPWAAIDGYMRRAAVLETLAHLRALEVRHLVEEIVIPDAPSRWQLVAGATA
jgi:hypothetical protein